MHIMYEGCRVVRFKSQSGRGSVARVMQAEYSATGLGGVQSALGFDRRKHVSPLWRCNLGRGMVEC